MANLAKSYCEALKANNGHPLVPWEVFKPLAEASPQGSKVEDLEGWSVVLFTKNFRRAGSESTVEWVAMFHVLARGDMRKHKLVAEDKFPELLKNAGFTKQGFAGSDSTPETRKAAVEELVKLWNDKGVGIFGQPIKAEKPSTKRPPKEELVVDGDEAVVVDEAVTNS